MFFRDMTHHRLVFMGLNYILGWKDQDIFADKQPHLVSM